MNETRLKPSKQKSLSRILISNEFKNTPINDKRIVKCLTNTIKTLAENPGDSIPKACQSKSKTKAVYRLLNNKKVSHDAILAGHRMETMKRVGEYEIVLSIQDTTLLDYSTLKATKGLGPIHEEHINGLFVHTALALNTNGTPIGILEQKVWARKPHPESKITHRKLRPIEEKESYKWLETMDKSLEGAPKNTTIVTVSDREADIFELFHKAVIEGKHLLIRATYDRRVNQEHKKLYAQVKSTLPLEKCLVRIPRNTEINTPPRNAWLMIQSCKVKLCPPYIKGKNLEEIELTVILAREIDPPNEVKPIEWLLLTTLEVETAEEAFEKVYWYSHRWKVERFHYVLKSGCRIEELQLETAERLMNALALYSFLAWRLVWITYQARETPDLPCTLILEDYEWKLLYRHLNQSTRLPKKPPTLKQAVVLVARLGGFLARKGDGDPGVKVLWRGLRELHIMSKTYLNLRSKPF